jgi:hypothetical protein
MIIQNIDVKRSEAGRLSRLSRNVPVCERVDRIRQGNCRWQEKTEEQMSEGGNAGNAGQMEEMIGKRNRELSRVALEEMMQTKADQSGRKCPVCGKELIRNKAGAERTIESRFGPVKVSRQRGWCAGCQEWIYPADHALGLTQGGCTPGMQEMAALMEDTNIPNARRIVSDPDDVEPDPALVTLAIKNVELYNLADDISERRNLADAEPERVRTMLTLADKLMTGAAPARCLKPLQSP